ncbi:glycosyltransferase [Planomicrobium sp. CPCC 101110]|uniref:glycosyltransferase n=1 Tax=Planomicrobium sp. CPCC 101110 TaxID=2599619 RepID=UPI0011B71E2B|nr:glycosyltransferase [Planomicrobium sp. CPCC 101110]TWT27851.1 glycosyltransferase family 2 protein [Planomicrobium sp. CPCC 101110]
MKHEIKVTVAIPVYNAEKYLRECLDSVVNQTMPSEDFEIICVNDKSKDDSLAVLLEYEKAHSNMVVIDREKNSGGASAPRNDAIEAAQGAYIFFLDSDDYLGLEALERLYNFACEHDSDIAFGKYKGVNGRGVPVSMFKGNVADADIIRNNLVYTLSPQKLFRTSLIKNNNLKFMTEAKTAEDQVFVMECYCLSNRISILSDYDYYYLTNREEGHLSASVVPPEEYFKVIGRVIDGIENGAIKNEVYKVKVKGAFLNRFLRHGRNSRFYELNHLTEQEKREWMYYFSKFINEKIEKSADAYVNIEFKDRLQCIRENNFEKIILIEEFKKNVNAGHVKAVENGHIIAEINVSNKEYELHEMVTVNAHNIAECILIDAYVIEDMLYISGEFYNSLLTNFESEHCLIFINRQTKAKREFAEISFDKKAKSDFQFRVHLKDLVFDLTDEGVWDISVVSKTKDVVFTKRIGSNRLKKPEIVDKNFKFRSGKQKFSIKPYITKGDNNFSLNVKALS